MIGAAFVTNAMKDRKVTLRIGGCHTEQTGNDAPKQRSRTAECDGCGYADDVAGTERCRKYGCESLVDRQTARGGCVCVFFSKWQDDCTYDMALRYF